MSTCVTNKQKPQAPRRLRKISDLVAHNLLPQDAVIHLRGVEQAFDIGISDHVRVLLSGIENPEHDPVGRQYIPSVKELDVKPHEEADPISDNLYSPVNGIVHRYPDRVLFKVTNVCAVYCRYCFRREMIGAGSDHLSEQDFDKAIEYIRDHHEVWEVILTGGDPLVLSPRRLEKTIRLLNDIEHVQSIRIHSRVPIADPAKIDDTLLAVLKQSRQGFHIVVHINHAKEMTASVKSALQNLRMANCSLYAQSVLLKGVNDSVEALEGLFKTLIAHHVKPYYLHHLDRAKGTSHFHVPIERGKSMMKDLQGRISGLCLPKYMLDIPGGHGKIPISEDYVRTLSPHIYGVQDYQGCDHLYFDRGPETINQGESA